MKTALGFISAILISANAWAAPTLTCSLLSGANSGTIAMVLEDRSVTIDEQVNVGEELDLGLILTAECEGENCVADALIVSAIVEDEVGDIGFEFKKSTQGVVLRENLTKAPDKRDYELVCSVAQ